MTQKQSLALFERWFKTAIQAQRVHEEESDEYDEWGMSIDNNRNLGQGFFNLFNENNKDIDEDIWYELNINEKELENKILVGNVENLIINKICFVFEIFLKM